MPSSSFVPSTTKCTLDHNINQIRSQPEYKNCLKRATDEDMYFVGSKKAGFNIRSHNKLNKRKVISTKMQKMIAKKFDTKMIFIAIFTILWFEASGTKIGQSLNSGNSQNAIHDSLPPIRNKRDSHIASQEGM